MSGSDEVDNPGRRNFLGTVTTVAGAGGAAAACWPFVSSMNPSADVLAKATTEVDLTDIPPGGVHTVAWQGKPVFIVHRTPEEIKNAQGSQGAHGAGGGQQAGEETGMAGGGRGMHPPGLRAQPQRGRTAGCAPVTAACMTPAGAWFTGLRRRTSKCRRTTSWRQQDHHRQGTRGDHGQSHDCLGRPAFPADVLHQARTHRIPHAAQPELLVELRLPRRLRAGVADRHRHLPRHALQGRRRTWRSTRSSTSCAT